MAGSFRLRQSLKLGLWIFHCHMVKHLMAGMALVFDVTDKGKSFTDTSRVWLARIHYPLAWLLAELCYRNSTSAQKLSNLPSSQINWRTPANKPINWSQINRKHRTNRRNVTIGCSCRFLINLPFYRPFLSIAFLFFSMVFLFRSFIFAVNINSCAFISILPRTFICQKIGMISISANQKFLLHHWIRRKILGGVPWNIFLIGRHLLYIRFRPLCQFFGRMKAQLLKLENFPEGNFMAFLIKGRLFDPLKCLKEVIFDPPPSHGLPNRNL